MSKYFGDWETECRCGCGGNIVSPVLMDKLDLLRELCGCPLFLSCAYRCPEHNAEVGGVPDSQHTKGNAADVIVPDAVDIDTLVDNAIKAGFDGIGVYRSAGFVHCDVRSMGAEAGEYRWEED